MRWKGGKVPPKQTTSDYLPCHPGLRAGIQSFKASSYHPTQKQTVPHNPNPRSSAPFIRVNLREPYDPGSSVLGWQSLFAQRPVVSSKQATPLPLPNGLRQPNTAVTAARRTTAGAATCRLRRDGIPRGADRRPGAGFFRRKSGHPRPDCRWNPG